MMFTRSRVGVFFCCLFLISLLCSGHCERKLETIFSPDCDEYPSCKHRQKIDLIYSTSFDNGTEKDHFISSTIGDHAGFLVTKSGDISFDWDQLLDKNCSNSLNITSAPRNSLGIVFQSFLDLEGDRLQWIFLNKSLELSERNFSAEYLAHHEETSERSVSIKMQISTQLLRYPQLPRLQYGPDSMHLEVILRNFTEGDIENFNLTMLVYTTHSNHSDQSIETNSDEYTPGVFERRLYKFYDDSDNKSFVEWKPLAYVSSERVVEKSVSLRSSNLTESKDQSMLNVPIQCFFKELGSHDVYAITVKFERDAPDKQRNENKTIDFMSWSLVMGFGDEPQEELSSILQWIIVVGIGLPAVILLISLIAFTIQKWKKSLNIPHSKLDEDILNY